MRLAVLLALAASCSTMARVAGRATFGANGLDGEAGASGAPEGMKGEGPHCAVDRGGPTTLSPGGGPPGGGGGEGPRRNPTEGRNGPPGPAGAPPTARPPLELPSSPVPLPVPLPGSP